MTSKAVYFFQEKRARTLGRVILSDGRHVYTTEKLMRGLYEYENHAWMWVDWNGEYPPEADEVNQVKEALSEIHHCEFILSHKYPKFIDCHIWEQLIQPLKWVDSDVIANHIN